MSYAFYLNECQEKKLAYVRVYGVLKCRLIIAAAHNHTRHKGYLNALIIVAMATTRTRLEPMSLNIKPSYQERQRQNSALYIGKKFLRIADARAINVSKCKIMHT